MIMIYKKNITREIPESDLAQWAAEGWKYSKKSTRQTVRVKPEIIAETVAAESADQQQKDE